MRVVIATDMEGAAGIDRVEQCFGGGLGFLTLRIIADRTSIIPHGVFSLELQAWR